MRKFVLFLGTLLFATTVYGSEAGAKAAEYNIKAWETNAAAADKAIATFQEQLEEKLETKFKEFRNALTAAHETCAVQKKDIETKSATLQKSASECETKQKLLEETRAQLKAADEKFQELTKTLSAKQAELIKKIEGIKPEQAGAAAGEEGDQS